MAESVIRIGQENIQSKLQENSGNHSRSVLAASADNRASKGLNGHKTNSPPLYIVGDVSPSPIPFHHVENIIQAAAYARQLGKPLYHHLTIRWPTGDWRHHEPILRQISEWLRYHVGCAAFVWAKEANGGPHSHILLHLPNDKSRTFRKSMMKQLKTLTGLRCLPKGTIQNRRIKSFGNPDEHMRNRLAYILKRADPDVRRVLGVGKTDIGPIEGKAVGVSQSLGLEARRKAGSVLPSGHRVTPSSWQTRSFGPHRPVTQNFR